MQNDVLSTESFTEFATPTEQKFPREPLIVTTNELKAGLIEEKTVAFLREAKDNLSGNLPEGKRGIVLGSGVNTDSWNSKGWETLDFDPRFRTTFTEDANLMGGISYLQERYNLVIAENITFSKTSLDAVGRGKLALEANKLLKDDGILIIRSGHIQPNPLVDSVKTLPDISWYPGLLTRHGFEVTVLIFNPTTDERGVTSNNVWYVCKKVSQGYDKKRYKPEVDSLLM